jgi:HEAT repeat protein
MGPSELQELSLNELMALFDSAEADDRYAFATYSEIADLLAKSGEQGVTLLRLRLPRANEAQIRAILFALSDPDLDAGLRSDEILQFLSDSRPLIVAEAVDGLRRRGAVDAGGLVIKLLHDKSPYVRGSAQRFFAQLDPTAAFPLLLDAVNDVDFIVRENAADELGALGRPEALAALNRLLDDPHPDVRQAAAEAIEALGE